MILCSLFVFVERFFWYKKIIGFILVLDNFFFLNNFSKCVWKMLVLMILSLLFVFVENVFWDNNYYLFCYGVWRIFLFFFHKEIIFLNVFEKLWSWWFFVSCLFLWKNFWKMFSRIIIIICFVIGFGEFLSSFFTRK